ncbi:MULTISPECIES: hypothetical protein [unclassified Cupriavidus]|uniref:hypothetical protein n=1 Tax=unclassified Cupriavidus TaxID=2640874 RepID=UPI001AE23FDE|nr:MULTISPECIES: hypothetical protein [unclassified Cupriavidus]MBP0632912.1 hypothetical protein [Cupriavidus sp. AcVe19-1a]MBP0639539.1 hypothetical protein [Cupriavidus sp. AcVe19-6a]
MRSNSSTFALVLLFCGLASAAAPVVDPALARAADSVQATIELALDEQSQHCDATSCTRLALLKVAMQSTDCKPVVPAIVLSSSLLVLWKGMPIADCTD